MSFVRRRFASSAAIAAVIISLLPVGIVAPAVLATASNDDFANATLIDGNALPFTDIVDLATTAAEPQGYRGCAGVYAVWYTLTPDHDMAIRADTVGSSFKSNVTLWEQSSRPFPDQIDCGDTPDQSDAGRNAFQRILEANQTYWFSIGGETATGTVVLTLSEFTPPANDSYADASAIVLNDLPFSASPDLSNATGESERFFNRCISPPGTGSAGGSQQAVWYTITPDTTTAVRAAVTGQGVTLRAWTTGSATDPKSLACSRAFQLRLEANQQYWFAVAAPSNFLGSATFTLTEMGALAPNDEFADAIQIDPNSLPYSDTVDMGTVTREDRFHMACGANEAAWYAFTPDQDMAVRADTAGSDSLVALAIMVPASRYPLRSLICPRAPDQNPASRVSTQFRLVANETYYFGLGVANSVPGNATFTLTELSAPANDQLADATVITQAELPYSTTIDVSQASIDPADRDWSCSGERSVWFSFTPDSDLAVRVASSDHDLGVYTSGSRPGLDGVSCGRSTAHLRLNANQTYWFEVGPNGTDYNATLQITEITSLAANDEFADATQIDTSVLPFTDAVDVGTLTAESEPPFACATDVAWYSFTPDGDMAVRIDTAGSDERVSLTLFQAGSNPTPRHLVCGGGFDDTASDRQAIQVKVFANQTYWIAVGYDDNFAAQNEDYSEPTGDIVLSMSEITPPTNDDFADATQVSQVDLPYATLADTGNATLDPDNRSGCGGIVYQAVWYEFTPDEDLAVRTSVDAGLVAVFTTGSRPGLTRIICGEVLQLDLVGNQTYWFQVGGPKGSTNSTNFTLRSLSEVVSEDVDPGDTVTTDSETDGATPDDPIETSVTSSASGTVSITETANSVPPPAGYSIVGYDVQIEAPDGTAAEPLSISIRIDASIVPAGETAATLQLLRNSVVVPDCSTSDGTATPDPCVSDRTTHGDGDIGLTALTSQASLWQVAASAETVEDTTKPVITADVSPAANGAGWNDSAVTVSFTCEDEDGGSGVDVNTLADVVLSADGAGQSASSSPGECSDAAGNTADPVTVSGINIDTTLPDVTVPADITVAAKTLDGAPVSFSATFSDALSGVATSSCDHASGSVFALGTTLVTCSATDVAGNTATDSFSVTVLAPYAAKQFVLAQLQALPLTGNKQDDKRIKDAIASLQHSLLGTLWRDEATNGMLLEPKTGHQVFDDEKLAAVNLSQIKTVSLVSRATAWTGMLADADSLLAQVAISMSTDAKAIADANKKLTQANSAWASGNVSGAFDGWKNAWSAVTK